ncbi:hypothetical protein U1Q18_016909 [Sarracenia purpurea var. burkii]
MTANSPTIKPENLDKKIAIRDLSVSWEDKKICVVLGIPDLCGLRQCLVNSDAKSSPLDISNVLVWGGHVDRSGSLGLADLRRMVVLWAGGDLSDVKW